MSMLEINNLCVSYGAIQAVKGVSLNIGEGEIVALIGANGAGKTTILRTISGLEKAKSGSIMYMGNDITKMRAHKIVEAGIVHVPEGRRVFAELTVKENLLLGANVVRDDAKIKEDIERVYTVFPRLKERVNQSAGTLSGGEQQMLAFGRAMMSNGKLLLLDEPSMGLAPIIVEEIFNIIQMVNESGISILLIEQNAFLALHTAKRGYVLETGLITMEGEASMLLKDDKVREAYLGA